MSNGARTKLNLEEFQAVIDNYRSAGMDVSEMEGIKNQVFSRGRPSPHGQYNEREDTAQKLKKLRQQAKKSRGICSVCGKSGKLLDGVCEKFFLDWAASAVKAKGGTR